MAAQSSAPKRDGVFRYDIINLTTREVSVADGRQIVYGPYRAYFRVFPFGTGPAGFYEEREPHKDFRLMHTVPGLAGKHRDLSVDYRERWENPDKLVVTHIGQGSPEPHRIQRILTRVRTEVSEWDGVWRLQVKDVTADVLVPGENVWIRFGDYIGFFWQSPGQPLYAIYAKQEEKNKFRILFSTSENEVGDFIDHSKEFRGAWDGARWVESYVETTQGNDRFGHRMRVTYEAIHK
jgi:hypothetical protein